MQRTPSGHSRRPLVPSAGGRRSRPFLPAHARFVNCALRWQFVALLLAAVGPAYAHTIGVSRGDYRLLGANVTVELVFARPELAGAVPELDTNQDGLVSSPEIANARSAIDQAIVQSLEVRAPSGPCVGALADVALTEQDGLSIRAVYRCRNKPETLLFKLSFLGALLHGHRHLATATATAAILHAVAYKGNSDFQLAVPHEAKVENVATGATVWPLFHLGVQHILTGYDHLVFLLGLILVGGRLQSLLVAVTAFTVAHSLTLGLAVLGVWAPSTTLVEPAIALSIAYVGVENWFVKDTGRRWLITFPFGLIHGFGFAGALQQVSLSQGQIPLALAAFNAGVEAGQIAVLVVVLPAVRWLHQQPRFTESGMKAMSAGIAVAGVWWFFSRVA